MQTVLEGCSGPSSGVATGQVYTPPAPDKKPTGNTTPTDTSTTVNRQQPDTKSPFGEEIPLFNPGDETIKPFTFRIRSSNFGFAIRTWNSKVELRILSSNFGFQVRTLNSKFELGIRRSNFGFEVRNSD